MEHYQEHASGLDISPPKKVLFVIGSLSAGGAERQMVLLIERLVRLGVHCEVFVFDGNGPLRTRLDAENVPVHVATRFRSVRRLVTLGNIPTFIRAFAGLWWLARTNKPDVLQAYLPLTNFIGAVTGRLAGVPLIVTCRRGLGTHQDRHRWWRLFDRVANRLSHVVTVNSRAVADDTVARDRISPSKLVLIRNGLDDPIIHPVDTGEDNHEIRLSLGLRNDEIGIVNVANLIPYKGHADLLRAFAAAHARLRPSRLFIVGRDDGIGSDLNALAVALGIAGKVHFLGARNDAPRILRAMDVFVLPSHEEGSSNALLEAMACGLPIVTTDVGGNREALENGRFGLLVPPRAPIALAEALQTVARELEARRDIGREAAAFVRSAYSSEALVHNYIALYRRKSAF
jgi:glycosyltransferase involved in cell wall biosynthesis